jgi:hypothetical protein
MLGFLKSLHSRLRLRITEPTQTKKRTISSKPIAEQNREPLIHMVGGTSARRQCGSRAVSAAKVRSGAP